MIEPLSRRFALMRAIRLSPEPVLGITGGSDPAQP